MSFRSRTLVRSTIWKASFDGVEESEMLLLLQSNSHRNDGEQNS